MSHTRDLEDILDRLTAEYMRLRGVWGRPDRRVYLDQMPAAVRPGLERAHVAVPNPTQLRQVSTTPSGLRGT